jgi:predicted dehydrogenase
MQEPIDNARRQLIVAGGLSVGAGLIARTASVAAAASVAAIDAGTVSGEQVHFAPIQADTERPDGPVPTPDRPDRRVGFAIMGLGRLALHRILPAFAECRSARPVALISGDPIKMRAVASQYGIAAASCYSYADVHKLRENAAVQAVYVVLPNALHRDAVIQAAAAGKHVLCEKPMATTPEDAQAMVQACKQAGRHLMIAYRCQYEIYNRELARRARNGEFGSIQLINAVNTQNQGDPQQWRHDIQLAGGGALPDVGLYCLNTSRALLGEEPIEVSAMIATPANDPRFKEVEDTVSFTLRFPSGVIANCATSYSAHVQRSLHVLGANGSAQIDNAFDYEGQRLRISNRNGEADENREISLGRRNQFSLEIDHMAECIRAGRQPRTPGEEGLQDQILMAAIYEAARTGRRVRFDPQTRIDAYRGAESASD